MNEDHNAGRSGLIRFWGFGTSARLRTSGALERNRMRIVPVTREHLGTAGVWHLLLKVWPRWRPLCGWSANLPSFAAGGGRSPLRCNPRTKSDCCGEFRTRKTPENFEWIFFLGGERGHVMCSCLYLIERWKTADFIESLFVCARHWSTVGQRPSAHQVHQVPWLCTEWVASSDWKQAFFICCRRHLEMNWFWPV